jgi:hypothetical protein
VHVPLLVRVQRGEGALNADTRTGTVVYDDIVVATTRVGCLR